MGYNLLGQGGAATAARMAPIPEATPAPEPIIAEPKLGIAWGDFHQGVASNIRTLFSWPLDPKNLLGADYFKECWIERRIPWRAVVAAALWHVVFLLSPFSLFNTALAAQFGIRQHAAHLVRPDRRFPHARNSRRKTQARPARRAE